MGPCLRTVIKHRIFSGAFQHYRQVIAYIISLILPGTQFSLSGKLQFQFHRLLLYMVPDMPVAYAQFFQFSGTSADLFLRLLPEAVSVMIPCITAPYIRQFLYKPLFFKYQLHSD